MTIFDLLKIDWIDAKLDFYYLIKDGKNQFKDFEQKLIEEGGYNNELVTIQARMQEMGDLKLLPKTKCRNITPRKDSVKEYEIKTRNLRVYLFHLEKKGRIVVTMAKKKPKSQKKEIAGFRKIKREFLKSYYAQ